MRGFGAFKVWGFSVWGFRFGGSQFFLSLGALRLRTGPSH